LFGVHCFINLETLDKFDPFFLLELSYVGCMLSFKYVVVVGTNFVQVWGRGTWELKRFKKLS